MLVQGATLFRLFDAAFPKHIDVMGLAIFQVIIPTREDIFSKPWSLGDLINKDSYSMSFLIAQIEDWGLDKSSKTKVK